MPELPWIFTRLNLRAIIDILAVALIFFGVLWVAQGTRANQLIRGIAILVIAVVGISYFLNLTALKWLLSRALPALVVAIPIIFQPELRRALEQLGHTGSWLRPPFAAQGDSDLERTVEEIARAAAQLARLQYGALIVVERETRLQNYIDNGVQLDANLTRQLLINIFFPNSPLHDGAAIVRGDRIIAAGCVLPLSENIEVGSELGTRHRAGLGITEESDALSVIVSEETGRISVGHNGRLNANLDPERLRRVLGTLLRLDQVERGSGRASERERPTRISEPQPPSDSGNRSSLQVVDGSAEDGTGRHPTQNNGRSQSSRRVSGSGED